MNKYVLHMSCIHIQANMRSKFRLHTRDLHLFLTDIDTDEMGLGREVGGNDVGWGVAGDRRAVGYTLGLRVPIGEDRGFGSTP